MSTAILAAPATTYWIVKAVDGVIEDTFESHLAEPYAEMSISPGRLLMNAVVPAVSRATAIAAARDAWRDLAANLDGAM